jgi:hypothetical protein
MPIAVGMSRSVYVLSLVAAVAVVVIGHIELIPDDWIVRSCSRFGVGLIQRRYVNAQTLERSFCRTYDAWCVTGAATEIARSRAACVVGVA